MINRRHFLLLCGTAWAATGCDSPPKTGTVTGKVTVGGKPVSGGGITFRSIKKPEFAGAGTINMDGTYTAEDVPVGELQVAIFSNPPANAGGGESPKARAAAMANGQPITEEMLRAAAAQQTSIHVGGPQVPQRYNDTITSNLSFKLEGPTGSFDVDCQAQ